MLLTSLKKNANLAKTNVLDAMSFALIMLHLKKLKSINLNSEQNLKLLLVFKNQSILKQTIKEIHQ